MAVKEAPVEAKSGDVEGKKKKGGKKKLIIIAVVVLALLGAAYFLVLKPKPKATGPVKPDPGPIVKLDPININLADGHYLKLGIALQTTKKAKEPPEGSAALDSAITLYTGKSMKELSVKKQVEDLKEQLLKLIEEDYPEDVMGLFFTQFVMQ